MKKKRSLYDFTAIESKWQAYWQSHKTFKVSNTSSKPKFYVLDMFPYPSGEGLHTGHTLGYVASDVVARYKRSLGYQVLHPMGFDAFGLPAEQYAQAVGRPPRVTTATNIARYRTQLQSLGLSLDWEREVTTSDPSYYRWTQWLFLLLFDSWYDLAAARALPIARLVERLSKRGNQGLQAACDQDTPQITAKSWAEMDEEAKQSFLLHYRLAYLAEREVNWCPALGTVLANDEVKEGFSERGGHPVVKKRMKQWILRITAYADRLLEGLAPLEWSDALKEIQRNWIGRSEGAEIHFRVEYEEVDRTITTFTTRPETIFGVTYLILAPEHPYVDTMITSLEKGGRSAEREALERYRDGALNLSERKRMQQADQVSGVFTGFYATHPFTQKSIPIWVGDYVLGSYGTGAVMGVPAHDSRDYAFASYFDLPIIKTLEESEEAGAGRANPSTLVNADFLNGMSVDKARKRILEEVERRKIGRCKVQYRLRDAVFSRQRYWGEPFPIYYKEGVAYPMDAKALPVQLPPMDDYKPTSKGEPPLARAQGWKTDEGHPIEYHTMPGWAGSSWYFFRYMDPQNPHAFLSREASDYWGAVDLYIGGAEHATGHLLYARFFTKVLYDLGHVAVQEPFMKLLNQGMIQATSHFVYRIQGTNQFVSHGKKEPYKTTPLRVDHKLVEQKVLDCEAFKAWRADFQDATFILEDGHYICGQEVEKMSKSKHNAINPDEVVRDHGADTFRLYMMFLGPITQSKPWNTQGIEGVARFLQKVWKLFHSSEEGTFYVRNERPSPDAARAIHSAIKAVQESMERYSLNTAVSSLMICLNKLLALRCSAREVLEAYVRLLGPLAPHLAEELWEKLGHQASVLEGGMPTYDPVQLIRDEVLYPVAINGKRRTTIKVPRESPAEVVEEAALSSPEVKKWTIGKKVEKVVVIPRRMVNLVVR